MATRQLLLANIAVIVLGVTSFTVTQAVFSDAVHMNSNVFAAANVFPSPSASPTPIPSSSPQPTTNPVNHIVISEIFYAVDSTHAGGGDTNIVVAGNGAGSNTTVVVSNTTTCTINQTNATTTSNTATQNASTGNNSVTQNASASAQIQTGSISQSTTIINNGGSNNAQCNQDTINVQDSQWVELYNPTNQDINLQNFMLSDNSGIVRLIMGSQIIKAKSFALISPSATVWQKWSIPATILQIAVGTIIGDGLQPTGDRLVLKNNFGITQDQLSWGSDTSVFTLPVSPVGQSLGRTNPNIDTDTAADFSIFTIPNPGS